VKRFSATGEPALLRSPFRRYLFAASSVALSTMATLMLPTLSQRVPFLMFWPAVMFSLWYAGFRPALFATLLSAVAVDFLLIPPYLSFAMTDWKNGIAQESLFIIVTVVTTYILDTKQRKAEFHIALQSELLEKTNEAIFITDRQHSIIYWNGGSVRLYGWSKAEALGKDPRDLLLTEFPESRELCDQKLMASGSWQGRLLRRNKGGDEVITESSWTLHRDNGAILQTNVNVTERSRAELEEKRLKSALNALNQVNQALLHAQGESQLLQQAVEIISESGGFPLVWVGVPENDPECSVKLVARAGKATDYLTACKITWKDETAGRGPAGTALREGRGIAFSDFVSAPSLAFWQKLAKEYELRSVVSEPLIVDGETIAVLTVYASERDAFGKREVSLIAELAGDLSVGIAALRARKKALEEQQLRQSLEEQLQQSQRLETVGQLAGGIAHDFNNLLMVIMAQTELLSMDLKGDSLDRAEKISQSAQRAATLTGQLLAFSRKQVIQPQIMSLNQLMPDVSEMLKRLLPENITVRLALCEQPWMVEIDCSQFQRVIMNLAVNARDAMPDGGTLTIETSNFVMNEEQLKGHPLVPPGEFAMLAVSDTGVGMSPAVKARAFEPFFTTKEKGKGTGLGLPMIYGIVKQSNGFVWLYSEEGLGSCFKVFLPRAHKLQGPKEEPISFTPPKERRKATILMVEDDPLLRDAIEAFLVSGGHSVIPAAGAAEACQIAFARRHEIDLLLTDVVLREGNGKQLAIRLKEQGCTFKVIYMSGYAPNAIVHHGVMDPGTMFLQKPFARNDLLEKVEEAVGVSL